MEPEEIRTHITSMKWYHTLDLGQGIETPGDYDLRPYLPLYGLPVDMTGLRALDVGSASGFFSFEMERRGAEVVAIDLPAWMAHDFSPVYRPDMAADEGLRYLHEPFAFAQAILGSRVQKRDMSVYDLSSEELGKFDVVFCGSMLLHITDPIRALWRIQDVTRGVAIIATVIHPPEFPEPLAYMAGHQRGDCYWFPNRVAFKSMVQTAGFAGQEWFSEFRLDYRDGSEGLPHGVIRAWNSLDGIVMPPSPANAFRLPRTPLAAPAQPDAGQVALQRRLEQQEAELGRLRALAAGYENGRFMRAMRLVNRATSRLRK